VDSVTKSIGPNLNVFPGREKILDPLPELKLSFSKLLHN
jgi:hypothetical protein